MSAPLHRLCLIEDDDIMGESLCDRFQLEGYACDWYRSGSAAVQGVARVPYALIISDYRLPDTDGETLFRQLQQTIQRLPPVLFITGYGAIDRAVQLLKMGAADYLTKPFDIQELLDKIGQICLARPRGIASCDKALGVSSAMRQIEQTLPRLAMHARNILITGESGVGKERVAMALHSCGSADTAPFVAVNCGAINEGLLEAELFGHEKGAFTGSVRHHRGVFEQANGGTLFLDEIGEMPLPMQVRLLRVVQERAFVRVGGETPIRVNLRLICATHRDLRSMVEEGRFREDLYYRINVITLKIPPLRERREDILWLADVLLDECQVPGSGEKARLSPEARQAMLDYPWPGNVRELRHCLERACILAGHGVLSASDLFDTPTPAQAGTTPAETGTLADHLQTCERLYIGRALNRHQGHISETAAELGISRKNLWEKMKKLGLSSGQPGSAPGQTVAE